MNQYDLIDEVTGDPVNFCWICDGLFDTYELAHFEGNWVCHACMSDSHLNEDETEEYVEFLLELHNWKLEGF